MTERVWLEAEIEAFKQAEPELEKLGMYVSGRKGDENAKQFVKFFELQPDVPVTIENLLSVFEGLKQRNMLHVKSAAQMRFEKCAANMAPQDLDTLEKFLKANRLYPSDDEAYLNACQFINFMGGRPYTFEVLAHLALPQIQGSSKEPLYWKTPGQASTYRLAGKHSGGDSHFAPRAETNIGSSFVGRIDHAKHPSTQIPRPAPASKSVNEYFWKVTNESLARSGATHSENTAIERAIKEAGGGEAGYEAGMKVKNQLRVERERGR